MLLSVATPEETPIIVFQKAYCALARAIVTNDRTAFSQAGETFDDAIADSQAFAAKQKIPASVSSTWRILTAVSRLVAGAPLDSQAQSLTGAVDASDCQTNVAGAEFCRAVHQLGSAWLGRIALEKGDRSEAARRFAVSNSAAWTKWVAGAEAFRIANYAEAASDDSYSVQAWRRVEQEPMLQRLYPRPEPSAMLTEWAGAELALGNDAGALPILEEALKADPSNSQALFLRGITKERSGRGDALEDYDRAGRAAFAKEGSAAGIAEAHFYRGVLLFRRKEFVRAENEFSSALNADEGMPWRADARAWRGLAAVAGGSCGASREYLQRSLSSVSPYFPKQEALAIFAACPATAASLPIK
jgi:tetratricopeptide (TPR) repeat protein